MSAIRENDAPAAAMEQPNAELGFKRGDAAGDRGLVGAKIDGGSRHAPCLDRIREDPKIVRVHACGSLEDAGGAVCASSRWQANAPHPHKAMTTASGCPVPL